MSPSDDDITDEDIANSPFHGKATARIAQESGDPPMSMSRPKS